MEEYSFYLKVKTTGWVGFGFAKETSKSMKGYDVAIGGVDANGRAYINVRADFQLYFFKL